MKTPSQLGRMKRNKGKVFERQVARDCREAGLTHAKRGWQARKGTDAPDIDADPLSIECKHQKRPNCIAALMQAQENAPGGTYPAAVVKQDGCDPTVTMFWADFLEIVGTLTFARIWGVRDD